jgi:hypothetical protein
MIRRILAFSGMSISIALAQTPAPKPATSPAAKPAQAAAKPATTAAAGKYVPPKTAWGEPDLQGIWPLNHLIAVPLQRQKQYGDRLYLTEDEVAKAKTNLEARNKRFESGPIPQADTSKTVMKQTSLISFPENGQFPELTPYGKEVQSHMESSYKPGKTVYDSIEDFAAWDRCITRGMPVSMEPRNYNNGIRIMQSPGYVVILLEMAHEARVIPTRPTPALDDNIREWMGESRGHWEGNTLVVETANFNGLVGATSAGVPGSPGPLQPETPDMKIEERFTRVSPTEIDFKMTITDPKVLASGHYTVEYPTFLDNSYEMFEYACHEGNTAVRNYIQTSRYEREHPKPPSETPARGGRGGRAGRGGAPQQTPQE